MSIQDETFCTDEGDAWFRRNERALTLLADKYDAPLEIFSKRDGALGPIRSVCEVGCANGWRLAKLRQIENPPSRLVGFDASRAAIEAGRTSWPDLELDVAVLDESSSIEPFDVVIVSFVLHWVDRSRLARAIAAVDALVAIGGALIVNDFLPNEPCARRYHHRSDVDIFTYKQDYSLCFKSLGTYAEEERVVYDHSLGPVPISAIDEQDRALCSVLRKSLTGYRSM